MRHRVAHRKLGRVTEHRVAMLRNQATALIRYEHIETTVPKAKELRPFVERLITIAKRGVAAGDGNGRLLHARRLVGRELVDGEVVIKLFDTIAPRFAERPGRLHAHPAARLPPRRQRRDGAARAGRQRVRSEGRADADARLRQRSRKPASAAVCARRPIVFAARSRGCRCRATRRPRRAAQTKGRRRKANDSSEGRLDFARQGFVIRDSGLGQSRVTRLIPNP